MQLKTHSNYYWSASFLSNFRRQLRKPTFQVKLHVEEDFCDRLVSLSPVPPRCRWPLDRWSRPPLLWTPRWACWLPWACLPVPSRCRRSVDGLLPPPPPPSDPPPRRCGENDPLGGDEPGLFRLRFCSEYQWGRLSSTEESGKAAETMAVTTTKRTIIIRTTEFCVLYCMHATFNWETTGMYWPEY